MASVIGRSVVSVGIGVGGWHTCAWSARNGNLPLHHNYTLCDPLLLEARFPFAHIT